jgi:DNA-binding IclR family transcriptional regulator
MTPIKKPKTIQVIDRAVQILNLLAQAPDGANLSRLSQAMDLKPQTVQSIIRSLENHRFVYQPQKGASYWLGPAFNRLAQAWETQNAKAALAKQVLLEFSRRIDEYLLLVELKNHTLSAIVEIRSQQLLNVNSIIPLQKEIHVMATGKVLLAYSPKMIRDAILSDYEFTKLGPQSLTSREKFFRQLSEIRRTGFAVCRNETNQGIGALAVPLFGPDQTIVAALGTYLPLARLDQAREKKLCGQLYDTARRIEKLWRG